MVQSNHLLLLDARNRSKALAWYRVLHLRQRFIQSGAKQLHRVCSPYVLYVRNESTIS